MKLKSVCAMWACARVMLLGTFMGLISAPVVHAQALLVSPSPESSASPTQPAESVSEMLRQVYQSMTKGELDASLDKVNEVIKLDPQNKQAFLLRATIYAQQKQWDKADKDYNVVRSMDPESTIVKFDLAELNFMQKKYDDARDGFKGVEGDKEIGDYATYKVLLCDLFGAHEAAAAKDLEALNQVAANPSYYFGNAAWDLVHNKTNDAAAWLKSAVRIYGDSPQKFVKYTACLKAMGYLPIHLSSAAQ